MAKKRPEHIVFDQMLKQKKHLPLDQMNHQVNASKRTNRKTFIRRENMGGGLH